MKFIRFAEHFIEKNQEGVLAFITNYGYLDNPTFRGMRQHLMRTFNKIYLLDLHGNSLKKETSPDGSKDENVFDIQAGVSIILGVKTNTGKSNKCEVYHSDLFDKRDDKYSFLEQNYLGTTNWVKLSPQAPYYFFVEKDLRLEDEYAQGVKLNELFPVNTTGIVTMGDSFIIGSKEYVEQNTRYLLFNDVSESELKESFGLGKNYAKWVIQNKDRIHFSSNRITPIEYRPFDTRYTYFDGKLVWRLREKVMQHMLNGENLGLISARSNKSQRMDHFFMTDKIMETKCGESTTQSAIFPLYFYPPKREEEKELFGEGKNTPPYGHPSRTLLGRLTHAQSCFKGNLVRSSTYSNESSKANSPSQKGWTLKADGVVPDQKGWQAEPDGVVKKTDWYNLPFNPKLKDKAKELRKAGNLSEALFWNKIKNRQLAGLDFDRQKIIGNYIVDFYCSEIGLVVEIDGESHSYKGEYDEQRDEFLKSLGLTVIHLSDKEVKQNLDLVVEGLVGWIEEVIINQDFNSTRIQSSNKNTPLFTPEDALEGNCYFTPTDLLDYIYAVLHSPTYREKYKEFLKIDFPKVPITEDKEKFWKLVGLGKELRQFHLLEHPESSEFITQFPVSGSNRVTDTPKFSPSIENREIGSVFINESQYFKGVPKSVFEFFIGGYQPAQKRLKDRKRREVLF